MNIIIIIAGLTDKIELKLIDEEYDNENYLSLDIPTLKNPRTVYSIKKYLLSDEYVLMK
jgi:predicted HTH transcriptional regulator